MADWLSSMKQTFEYYVVDPGTWKDVSLLTNVKSCTITRDSDTDTLGSATIDITESVGECYIRIYLITDQNGVREKHALGTYLVQTPSSSFDGKVRSVTMDAYTPLIELKEKMPPLGYCIEKGTEILSEASRIARTNMRGPVISSSGSKILSYDFVANTDDTWMTFLNDLVADANTEFSLDELGRVLFSPKQDVTALQAVWTYNDDNSSILYPDITMDHDMYGIPNVVEVAFSNGVNQLYARSVNDDPNSPTSTVNRGREIIYRDTEGNATLRNNTDAKEYADKLLEALSTVEYSVSYTHGYCPVRVGDCVRLNYTRAGITNVKARVISQTIKCESGCSVSEKAIFTTKLWR